MVEQPNTQNLSPEHLLTLYEITAVMNSSLEFDDALQNIIDSVMEVTRAQRGYLLTVQEHIGSDDIHVEVLASRSTDGKAGDEEGYSTTIIKEVTKSGQPLLTNNAQFDDRFQVGQSIIVRGLRAILCAPLMTKGRLIGALYVDTSMRKGNFTPADRDLLMAVAGQAAIALENARLYTIAVEKGRLERELQMASEIQQSLLPSQMPQVPGYQVAASWEAAREVAGDFYDAFVLDDGRLAIVMADVSDKGAPAALFMAVARTMIRSHAHAGLGPMETLARTNDLILEDAESGMFVTVYHSVFGPEGLSQHVNAGHNPPLFYRHETGEAIYMPRGGRAIGWFPDNPLEMREFAMAAGDLMIYYTDGITEAENPQGDFFGEERLMQVVMDNADLDAVALMETINEAVTTFCDGAPPFDDMTLVVVRCTA